MTTFTLAEAKASFSEVIREVERGNQVTITKYGHPAAIISSSEKAPKKKRGLVGCMKKQFGDWEMPEDFDTMCQEEIIALFENSEIR